ncbi:MAG: MMPL family transporter, partial [Elusimicrobia bacterium]|nr:MMPL family transporter [Elusimicrobiota bacterium]
TLTLPGIAGIALNVAMAVAANVLILERIREELRRGKPIRLAVDAGFDQSASAILDSNLTVLAAAALLFQFGTGPIKGFAVTLTIGTIISMFTANVCTRMMYEYWLSDRDVTELSI